MRLGLVALFALAACQPAQTPNGASPEINIAEPSVPALPLVTTLAGEWRVAGVDGKEFNQPVGIALSADDEEIWWAPRCAGVVHTYRIQGASFSTGPHKGYVPRKPGEPTPPVCAIGLPQRLDEVVRALTSATTIRRTANNGVELSGGGHSLLLFSQ